jgi:prophage regulatory protein
MIDQEAPGMFLCTSKNKEINMISYKEFIAQSDRIIDQAELVHLVGISKSHLTRLEKCGQFPRRIKLGTRKVGWSLQEVKQWVEDRKTDRQCSSLSKEEL